MPDTQYIVPDTMQTLLTERNTLWNTYNAAQAQAAQLQQIGRAVAGRGTASTLTALTTAATPPAEVAATIPQLERQITLIQTLEQTISSTQEEIASIKRRDLIIKASLVAVAILIVLFFILRAIVH